MLTTSSFLLDFWSYKKFKLVPVWASVFLIFACGEGAKDIESLKKNLKEKQMQVEKLQSEIKLLEKEIIQLDPKFVRNNFVGILITTLPASKGIFNSYVEVQGTVKSENNIDVTAETSGIIRQLLVTEGQFVSQGQLLASQDNEVILKNMEEVKTSLQLAELTFKRQENLWNQKIGTELQYLQAKNNKESLEKRLQTLQAQLGQSNIYAPFSGEIDQIYLRKGQTALPGSPIVRLVSSGVVKVVAEVSETYLTKIKRGDVVTVSFPSLKTEKQATISVIGATINPDNRTFRVEAKVVNSDGFLKPDLLATIKLKNEQKAESITVPANLIQRDKAGDFVFIVKNENKKMIARKIRVQRGETYQNHTVIVEGLKGDEQLIDEGFREVLDGAEVQISKEKNEKVAEK